MKRIRHSPEQIINKLREADAMLAAGKSVASCFVPRSPSHNLTAQGAYLRRHGREAFDRARARYGGSKL